MRGKLGELLLKELLEELGIEVENNDETDRTKKHWDIYDKTREKYIEVKTASQGKKGTFQYEGFEKDRSYDSVVLFAISPEKIYITCAKKDELPWKRANDLFTKRKKEMHHRAHGIQYKWTLSLKDLEDREIISINDFQKHYQRIK